ncbi:SDR family mycofactocin-dependent oxidoreductase [Microbacterium sp. AK009]|uniref:mycofactocin-coupled SDR family oxidoreductase n=1 Tax=Microbacterium sp. AK009 TaxID=2723068 RepID=UPI0015C6C15C|nr:mycofactocin-coupled SDR family oxidoreductase [Microbacterium sp. AK009]NYF15485.1 SDR family mycofactocin-dependent oxidoreductase [Microbacterium sp. AK009]
MAGRVAGKVALITGAARGQGRSHALRLAEEGADIIAVDLCAPVPNLQYPPATEEDLAETVRQVEALDRRIVASTTDVRDRDAFKAAIDEGVATLGKLDIVVGNAGICIIAAYDEVTPQIWDDTIATNLTGVFNTVQLSAPHLIAAGGGSIILTSSAAGLKGLPFLAPYVASKWGVTGLGKAFAAELAVHNIRVNTLHPTGVATPMGEMGNAFPPLLEKNPNLGGMLANMLPIQVTEPRDQSNAVLFLASDEARYITAMAMTVDAGNTQY